MQTHPVPLSFSLIPFFRYKKNTTLHLKKYTICSYTGIFNNEKALRSQYIWGIWSLFKTKNFKASESLLNERDKWCTQLCQISSLKKKPGTKPFICNLFYNDMLKLVIDTTILTTFNQIINQYMTQTVDQSAERRGICIWRYVCYSTSIRDG